MIKINKELQKKYSNMKDHTLQNISNNATKTIPRGAYLVLQMHDELIYELNELDLDEVYEIVKTNMENAIKFDIKMNVKIKVGKNWGSLKTFRC
jgi:DNA polymerase I-like protein with 3'-5' exonuclease and polymerase domains